MKSFVLFQKLICSLFVLFISHQALAQAKIVGGDAVEAEAYPWMCSITLDVPVPGCGATLIKPQWVVTAAHCDVSSFGVNMENILINSLVWNPDDMAAYSELIGIDTFLIHPDFSFVTGNGPDLALIRLDVPSTIEPLEMAELSDAAYFEHGDEAKTLGWGLTEEGGTEPSEFLNGVTCRFFNDDSCAALYDVLATSIYHLNPEGNICAGFFVGEDSAGSGAGDSGGPLFFTDELGNHKLVGVTSGGEGDVATEEFPGVYTLIPAYVDWIETTIAEYEAVIAAVNEYENLQLRITSSADRINIKFPDPNARYSIIVADITGRLVVHESTISGGQWEKDLLTFPKGVYTVRVQDEHTGQYGVGRFVASE